MSAHSRFRIFPPEFSLLESLAVKAEQVASLDAAIAALQLRKYAEKMTQTTADLLSIDDDDVEDFFGLLELLELEPSVDRQTMDRFHSLRKNGNDAAHSSREIFDVDLLLDEAFELAQWFTTMVLGREKIRETAQLETQADSTIHATPDRALGSLQGSIRLAQERVRSGNERDLIQFGRQVGSPSPRTLVVAESDTPEADEKYIDFAVSRGVFILGNLGIDFSDLLTQHELGSARITAAKSPFKLGVVGAFRVGKSTLVNGLFGREIAFVDVTEATAVISVYRAGDADSAIIRFKDGSESRGDIEGTNRELAIRRDDTDWLDNIDHVEFSVANTRLVDIEIWDGPGLGGNERNETLANRFIDTIGGALWVMDAELLGDQIVLGPIVQLNRSNKRVLGVLNRIDAFDDDEDQIAEAVGFVRDSFKEYLSDVIPVSALSLVKGDEGQRRKLLKEINDQVLSSAGSDRDNRISAAIGESAAGTCDALLARCGQLRDRIALFEHIKTGFDDAIKSTLERFQPLVEDAIGLAFQAELTTAQEEIRILNARANGDLDGRDVKKILETLNEQSLIRAAWPAAVHRVFQGIENSWNEYGHEALTIARAAAPRIEIDEVATQIKINAETESMISSADEAIAVGQFFTLTSAGALGVVAAASAAVTWPVMLAAIPIGMMAGYHAKKQVEWRRTYSLRQANDDLHQLIDLKRMHLKEYLIRELPEHTEALLRDQVGLLLEASAIQLLGRTDVNEVIAQKGELELLIDGLAVIAKRHLGSEKAPRRVDGDRHPIVITPNTEGHRVLSTWLGSIRGRRIDIITSRENLDITPILAVLRADTEVRWIATCCAAEFSSVSQQMRHVISRWKGTVSARVVRHVDNSALALEGSHVIFSDGAWITKHPLKSLGNATVTFEYVSGGYLKATRTFGRLWSGLPSSFGQTKLDIV